MKNHRVFSAFRALTLSVAALMVASMVVGCMVDSEGSEGSDQEAAEGLSSSEATETEPQGACCDWGSYTCPTTGATFDYDSALCGPFTKPQMKTKCENACPVTCIDSGWQGC
jgi:hypothetical protein